MKKSFPVIILVILMFALTACSNSSADEEISSVQQLNTVGHKVGVGMGTADMYTVEDYFTDAEVVIVNSIENSYEAVRSGQLDALAFDRISFQYALSTGLKGLALLDESIGEPTEICAGISPLSKVPDIQARMNEFVAEMKADGIMDDMYNRWFVDGYDEIVDIPAAKNPNGKLIVATNGTHAPYSYVKDSELTGIDIEIAKRFAQWANLELEFRLYDYMGMVAAAQTGEIDIILANLNKTPERAEKINFSDPFYTTSTSFLVKNDINSPSEVWGSIKSSFTKTFITENRWHLIIDGIGTTVYISFFSAILGTLLGFGLCMLRRLRNKAVFNISGVFVRVLQDTPIVVLLMILYYVIFSGTRFNSIWVSILAFAIYLSVYVCEMLRKGIDSVNIGQTEAALSLGYTKLKTFVKIVFPQAVIQIMPMYKAELISMIKMTSVVGYIAVQDLTMISDIIRSRTYEAFFPLIATAIIYLIIAELMTAVLTYVDFRITPNRNKRRVKGVTLHD